MNIFMEEAERYRIAETQRFLDWIAENIDLWEEMCCTTHEPSWEESKKIIDNLMENSFYNVIIIYLELYHNGYAINKLIKKTTMQHMANTLNETSVKELLKYINLELNNIEPKFKR